MKIRLITRLMPLAAAPVLLLSSCGGEQPSEEQKVDTTQTTEVVEMDTLSSFNLLPSPLQVAMIFDKSGMEFDGSFTNKLDNVKKYGTSWEKSINFGVYSADLAYAVLNEKSKEAGEIIKVVRDLSKEIGLSTVFESEDILGRFEKNLNNKDSVLDILFVIEEKTDDYIEENGEHALGNVMFAGAWIEGMFVGAQSTLKDKKSDIGAKLSEQMIICENLVEALSMDEASPEKDALIADLKDLDATYKSFESVKNLEGDEAYNVTLKDDEIKVLAEKLITLRNKIVKA
ncbi:MAG: hypothetical protein K1X56_01760 [Flavobacteriales bacterium]|nr:hypothetical protein [Flavobacteriales bacterium]